MLLNQCDTKSTQLLSILFGLASHCPLSRRQSGVDSSRWFPVLKVAKKKPPKPVEQLGVHSDSDCNDQVRHLLVDNIRPLSVLQQLF